MKQVHSQGLYTGNEYIYSQIELKPVQKQRFRNIQLCDNRLGLRHRVKGPGKKYTLSLAARVWLDDIYFISYRIPEVVELCSEVSQLLCIK